MSIFSEAMGSSTTNHCRIRRPECPVPAHSKNGREVPHINFPSVNGKWERSRLWQDIPVCSHGIRHEYTPSYFSGLTSSSDHIKKGDYDGPLNLVTPSYNLVTPSYRLRCLTTPALAGPYAKAIQKRSVNRGDMLEPALSKMATARWSNPAATPVVLTPSVLQMLVEKVLVSR